MRADVGGMWKRKVCEGEGGREGGEEEKEESGEKGADEQRGRTKMERAFITRCSLDGACNYFLLRFSLLTIAMFRQLKITTYCIPSILH